MQVSYLCTFIVIIIDILFCNILKSVVNKLSLKVGLYSNKGLLLDEIEPPNGA
jgi:hypothetical protein